MHHLNIDLETYSCVPLVDAGAYKYIQSPDFEILLLAYSRDNAPVQVIDLAQGEILPTWLSDAVKSPEYIKHAYNASFEIGCLTKYIGTLPLDQWRCTMLHGQYCGYPAGLDAVGKALGLPQDKQKLSTGKALIRYFCVPCNPTKVNGGRTRNRPEHDPEKWQLFKEYCGQDVVTEQETERRLSAFPVPDFVQRQWETDLRINRRGVAVDMDLVQGAIRIGADNKQQHLEEAVRLSGVENPNSIAQLKLWLENEMGEKLPDLRMDTVKKLLTQGNDPAVTRLLEIRQELCKTSTAKYDKAQIAVCADGRIRGVLRFYGANRTGRWTGSLVQVQNLPRTYLDPLPLARDLCKRGGAEQLRVIYGSVASTLSQLVRTCFIATPGNLLVDADFSSIEARVLAWLAGEQWKLEVFRTHGKIYEASASMMFGVPLEKIKKGNPEYALRQRGKVAELGLGYGMGAPKFKAIAEQQYGVLFGDEEAQDIVTRWRSANKQICGFWQKIGRAAVAVIQGGTATGVNGLILARELDPANGLDFLTIRLPSGRKLYYAHPKLEENQWGSPGIVFQGVNQTTQKWQTDRTYGAKLTENIVQAIARDCLAEAMERLEVLGYEIVFHVHDEVVIDCPSDRANLDKVTKIMAVHPLWAPDLPMGADGWVGQYFKKD